MASTTELKGDFRQFALRMERANLDVRRHWFGGREEPIRHGVLLHEPGGELLALVDAGPAEADELVAAAVQRGSYVLSTDYSRPEDLSARLRHEGYRAIQRNGVYVYDPALAPSPGRPLRGLFSRLISRLPLGLEVRTIGEGDLGSWNEVCWQSFGTLGSVEQSLAEKRHAFRSMGPAATWFLAEVGGKAVGVACLYEGDGASQVLAVGTLPAFRSRGVATAVMHRLIAAWEKAQSGVLFLDTKPGSGAERLYLGLGFRLAYIRELFALSRGAT